MPAAPTLSLRRQLLLRLLVPLAALFCIGAAASYYIALGFANNAYDRALYDSARALARVCRSVWARGLVHVVALIKRSRNEIEK